MKLFNLMEFRQLYVQFQTGKIRKTRAGASANEAHEFSFNLLVVHQLFWNSLFSQFWQIDTALRVVVMFTLIELKVGTKSALVKIVDSVHSRECLNVNRMCVPLRVCKCFWMLLRVIFSICKYCVTLNEYHRVICLVDLGACVCSVHHKSSRILKKNEFLPKNDVSGKKRAVVK